MIADTFLARLDKVKKTGSDSWLACCPAHGDKHPSMTVRELDDGRVLAHCFTGCSIEQILGALGLEFDALYPPKAIDHHVKPQRVKFNPRDVLAAVGYELTVASVCAAQLARGEKLSEEDHKRMLQAAERIEQARQYAND